MAGWTFNNFSKRNARELSNVKLLKAEKLSKGLVLTLLRITVVVCILVPTMSRSVR